MTTREAESMTTGTQTAAPGSTTVIRLEPKRLDVNAVARRYRYTQIVNILTPFVLLGLWQLATMTGVLDRRFFSPPVDIVKEAWTTLRDGVLWPAVEATLRRTFVGFGTGAVAGILVGVAAARVWIVRAVVNPLVAATYPLPKIALLPVLLLIFGTGDTSIYVVVGISVFFVVLMNTVVGVSTIPVIYQDVARTLHVGGLGYLGTVALPGALPAIFASLRTSWGIALVITVAAEFTSANIGLGQLILSSWQIFDVDRMYVGLVVSALIGWLSFLVIDLVERFVMPWRGKDA